MQKLTVVKIGGNVIDDETQLQQFLQVFSTIPNPKILIHGGGKLATAMAKQLNIASQLVDGRRITDAATLKVVTMVYAGLINKNIVATLQAQQNNAIGLTGADANLIQAHKRENASIDYGYVGDIDIVNSNFLNDLLTQNIVPVIAPITHNKQGQLLNTNADTIASSIAIALSNQYQVSLFYCFEKKGLLYDVANDESIISNITLSEIEELIDKQIITDGMIPKVKNIEKAINNGVQKIILCNAHDLFLVNEDNAIFGTTFSKA
ncbi:MAG: acetylglutamate kinase [Chitinophagales bacterium]|nr:acetylglutamate kinase [Chitinophagales bacterium]